MARVKTLQAAFKSVPERPNRHQFDRRWLSRFLSLSGFTKSTTCWKGASNRLASTSDISPKLIIHLSDGRRVTSAPFSNGKSTGPFVLPFGLTGRDSRSRAVSPSTSNAPTLTGPWKATNLFSLSFAACVRSVPPRAAERSAKTSVASAPSSVTAPPFSPSKHTIDTRTAAPSTVQASSAHASKNPPALDNRFQHLAVSPAANGVRRDQPGAGQQARLHLFPRLRKPVADQIGPTRHAAPCLA